MGGKMRTGIQGIQGMGRYGGGARWNRKGRTSRYGYARCFSNFRPILRDDSCQVGTVYSVLLLCNGRSINNKTAILHAYLTEQNMDRDAPGMRD